MLQILLPAPDLTAPLPALEVTAVLDGATCTLRLQWHETDSLWRMRVLDSQGATVLMGDVALVADWPLHACRVAALRSPPGLFIARDTSGRGANPGLTDLGAGARCVLWYVTHAEAVAAGVT